MKRRPLEPPDLYLFARALEEPAAAVAVSVGLLLLLLRRVATALLPGRMPADCCVRPLARIHGLHLNTAVRRAVKYVGSR